MLRRQQPEPLRILTLCPFKQKLHLVNHFKIMTHSFRSSLVCKLLVTHRGRPTSLYLVVHLPLQLNNLVLHANIELL